MVGEFLINRTHQGDCLDLFQRLPNDSVDVVVTSPPYWGQRESSGIGTESDPRQYLSGLVERFRPLMRVLKPKGIIWINLGDAFNTPVNWRTGDHRWSTLGADRRGLDPSNSAYAKPRHKRKAFVSGEAAWLKYGNLLALPYRLVVDLCEAGFYFRGEVIWKKANPMPEGRCRRPHRAHEAVYLLSLAEDHHFQIAPPVRSVWELANEGLPPVRHFSRFPTALPRRCISAYGKRGTDVIVLDPFCGSGTTGLAAVELGCSFIGFEIDTARVQQSNRVLSNAIAGKPPTRVPRRQAHHSGALLFEA